MISTSVSREEVKEIAEKYILNSAEASELLGCSRQYINKLVQKQKLIPIKSTTRDNIYYRPDVEKFKKKAKSTVHI